MAKQSINVRVRAKVKQLTEKARKNGLWENFGQDELREFSDEFSKVYGINFNYVNLKYPNFESKKQAQFKRDYIAIRNFSNWAPNFNC